MWPLAFRAIVLCAKFVLDSRNAMLDFVIGGASW